MNILDDRNGVSVKYCDIIAQEHPDFYPGQKKFKKNSKTESHDWK